MENKEKVVRKIARKIVKKYELVPPVAFDKIFEARNINYKEKKLEDDGDGYSGLKESKLSIVVNSETDYEPRKRFTIAHELGHIFIGWHDDVTLCKTDNEFVEHNMLDIQEKEANIFASELLMPYDWVRAHLNKGQDMKNIIHKLCLEANTSIMAVFYALENAMDSGNVLLVYKSDWFYPKKFVAAHTCNISLKDMDFEETCQYLSVGHNMFKIGNYTVFHYTFLEFPLPSQIVDVYKKKGNLLLTLHELANGNIFYLLHCMQNIIDVIDGRYILYVFYNEEQVSRIKGNKAEVVLPYDGNKDEIITICEMFDYLYEEQELEFGFEIFVIKEPIFIDNEAWRYSKVDSKALLNIILHELYGKMDAEVVRMSINGVIGAAKSKYKDATREELFDIMQKRLRRVEFVDFISHHRFDDFVSLKCYELASK